MKKQKQTNKLAKKIHKGLKVADKAIYRGLKISSRKLSIASKALSRSIHQHIIELRKLDSIKN